MPKINFLFTYWKTILICIIIFILSTATFRSVPKVTEFRHNDKIVHFLMYFGLGLISYLEYFKSKKEIQYKFLFVIFVLYGGFIEIIQGLFFKPRSAEWLDWIFDIVGLFFGFLVAKYALKYYSNRKNHKIDNIYFL